MKSKENQSKLRLNKQTVANLERPVMALVYGGDGGTVPPGEDPNKRPTTPCTRE